MMIPSFSSLRSAIFLICNSIQTTPRLSCLLTYKQVLYTHKLTIWYLTLTCLLTTTYFYTHKIESTVWIDFANDQLTLTTDWRYKMTVDVDSVLTHELTIWLTHKWSVIDLGHKQNGWPTNDWTYKWSDWLLTTNKLTDHHKWSGWFNQTRLDYKFNWLDYYLKQTTNRLLIDLQVDWRTNFGISWV